ncbi:CRAL-TRIO domain-containing protein C3H8.02 [Durusdinium trenchii]|uniref:CRAL-TRIO domain-containing protein C3H8.02 n=1 Tax=Durusdinium trenchii TaxID=1381693 RepID=A0ABP0PK67_9DINO
MGASLGGIPNVCCTTRGDEAAVHLIKNRHNSWQDLPEADEFQAFFDCYETHEDRPADPIVGSEKNRSFSRLCGREGVNDLLLNQHRCHVNHAGFRTYAERESLRGMPRKTDPDSVPLLPEDVYEDLVPVLRNDEGDLDEKLRVQLKHGFPELEDLESSIGLWRAQLVFKICSVLVPSQAASAGYMQLAPLQLRICTISPLEGGCGDTAVPMLMKAIECRVRERELFQSMRCKVACDMRIIGRDRENRPVIYLSARSQTEHLRELIPHVFLAFEAASRLAQEDGQAILVADMIQMQPSLNMDPFAFKDLANNFGVVFADRLKCILIVDFSFIAQAVWSTLRPFLSERTQKKINFVNEAKARIIVKETFTAPTQDRVFSSFDINRDELSTSEDRFSHALRTAICDVPLGELRAADEAG